jgi:hypothetical protein
MVSAFDQGNFIPRFGILSQGVNLTRLGAPAIKHDSGLEFGDVRRVRTAFQFYLVRSGDSRSARHQKIRQFAIVGQNHQAGGVKVQPSHRVDALFDASHQGDDRWAVLRVADRGNIPNGLIHK